MESHSKPNLCMLCGEMAIDSYCEVCFDRCITYLRVRSCFPSDLSMKDAIARATALDVCMNDMNIDCSIRLRVVRNLGGWSAGSPIPNMGFELEQCIQHAHNMYEAQEVRESR